MPKSSSCSRGLFRRAGGPHDELGSPRVQVLLHQAPDLVRRPQGRVFSEVGVFAQAGQIALGALLGFFFGGGYVEAYQGPHVVLIHRPSIFSGRFKHHLDALGHLVGSGKGNQPSVPDSSDPSLGRLAPSPDPDRQGRFLHGFGGDSYIMEGVELSLVGDIVLVPETAHDLHSLIGALAPVHLGHAAGLVLSRVFLAQPLSPAETGRRKDSPELPSPWPAPRDSGWEAAARWCRT